MKRKSIKRKLNKKSRASEFSLRDAWDILIISLLLSAVVYSVYYVRNSQTHFYGWPEIKYVNVKGNINLVDLNEFKEIIHKNIYSGFFRVPIEKLEQELAGLPWIYKANVHRYWPNTLSIHVTQQDPIARWGNLGLMNVYGDLYFPDSTESFVSLPMLYGEKSRANDLARIFEKTIEELTPLGLQLRALFEDERQSKHLVLSNGLVLAIGEGDVNKKITRFVIAYKKYLSPQIAEVKKVDLRYTNGLAIEWKNSRLAINLDLESNI